MPTGFKHVQVMHGMIITGTNSISTSCRCAANHSSWMEIIFHLFFCTHSWWKSCFICVTRIIPTRPLSTWIYLFGGDCVCNASWLDFHRISPMFTPCSIQVSLPGGKTDYFWIHEVIIDEFALISHIQILFSRRSWKGILMVDLLLPGSLYSIYLCYYHLY